MYNNRAGNSRLSGMKSNLSKYSKEPVSPRKDGK